MGPSCCLGDTKHEVERCLGSFCYLFILFQVINYFWDRSVISLWTLSLQEASLQAENVMSERGRDKERPPFPFDGSSISISSWKYVKELIKQSIYWTARAVLGPSFSSGNSCQEPNSLELV